MPKEKPVIKEEETIEELKPKADCEICGGKGFVECAGMQIAGCTCKFK